MNLISPTNQKNNFIQAMEVKIRPWLNKVEEEKHPDVTKKTEELCLIGKLLVTYFNEFSISELRESPDFVISNGIQDVGVELVRVVDQKTKAKEGFFETICSNLEREIALTSELRDFAVNLYFKLGIDCHPRQKKEISLTIKNLILDKITKDQLTDNEFIRSISVMKYKGISIFPNFGAYMQRHLRVEDILTTIKDKERKIENYRANSVSIQWLILVVGQLRESSFELRTEFDLNYQSKFDRIFIFEDFNNQLFELT
jgi:hypothetical protein